MGFLPTSTTKRVRTSFSILLREYRLAASLTQEALAERAGLSAKGIALLETGRRVAPRPETVTLLASALDLAPAERAALIAAAVQARTTRSESPLQPVGFASVPALQLSLTPLIGRERDVARVSGLLLQPGIRLVTLTGMGGVGKTRLAQQVATTCAASFADGIALVALAPLREPSLGLPTIAQTLGLRDTGERPLKEGLVALLRSGELLLLDNCEQVAQAAPEVTELLGLCPRLTVLATSRAPLHVRGEQELTVRPLALPDSAQVKDPEALGQVPSVALLVQRARAFFDEARKLYDVPGDEENQAGALLILGLVASMQGEYEQAWTLHETSPALARGLEQESRHMSVTPDSDLQPFGDLLKALRKRQHLTQQQLAKALGVHRHAIGRWERGDFLPRSRGMVLELASCLRLHEVETRQLVEASLTALAPHWHIPFQRNPFFTGREEVLETLHTHLGTTQAVALTQSHALYGLGGIGKTQIALEYAYRHALEYSAVFWIEAETVETAVSSLLRISEVLQVPERREIDQQRVVAAVQRWLMTHSQWLLIWDNVEDLALLDRLLPPPRQGALLLTTRCQTLGTLAQGVDLAPMGPEEGLLFLLRRAKMLPSTATGEDLRQMVLRQPAQYQAATELVAEMGGLALALDQAGAYLEATHCGLPAYLRLFRSQRAVLLAERGLGVREHPASVSSTFTLALGATTSRHPAVGDLLRVCALLQAEDIPEELFSQGASQWDSPLAAVCHNPLEWDQVLANACAYSLVSRRPEEQTLSIHRLVQATVLQSMTEAERALWSSRVSEALDAVFPDILPSKEYAVWKQCERLLPHALLCLSRTDAAGESLAIASLAYKAAQYLRTRGQFGQAEPLFHRALRLREHLLGSDHPEVFSPLHCLASIYWEQGDYVQAEPLLKRALHLGELVFGDTHPDVALTLNDLANLYWSQGRYAQAQELYERTLAIREKALGPEHYLVSSSLDNLAMIYAEQGDYVRAEPLSLRALTIREHDLGPVHPRVAFTLNNRAELLRVLGKYAEAELLHRRALAIRESALGPDHHLVATSLNNLGELAAEQGQYPQAEVLYQRALHVWEQALGPNHPYVAVALSGLAALPTTPAVQAQELYQRALRSNEEHLGPEHPSVAIQLQGLANLLRDQGGYAEAEALYQRALAIREQRLGPHHPETAQTLRELTLLRQQEGNLEEARTLAERALSIRVQSLGEGHPKTVAARTLYRQLVRELGHKHPPVPVMKVTVRGATGQIAYTRMVRMRDVTFTCAACGKTVTQPHHPSGQIKYCSAACRAMSAVQRHNERVAKQREKRRIVREARAQAQQGKEL